jgi:putative peptide zinc metalloprotease protein
MTDAPRPRRARMELLVRGDDGQDFAVREISSAAGFVQMRPLRVEWFELADVTSRVDQHHRFILRNTRSDRYLMLTENEQFLWEQMNGQTSLQEMATAYLLKYGQFDFDIIPNLIRKLVHAGLLTLTPASRLRRALARNRRKRLVQVMETALTGLERINLSSRRVQPFFAGLYRWGGFVVFSPLAVIACLLLTAFGVAAAIPLWRNADAVAAGLGTHPVLALLIIKVLLLLSVAAHQVVHALALVHYGRRVREFGFTFLHGFVPTFYVDVTDIFMASRRARVVTAVSGTLVHLVLGCACFAVAWSSPPGFVQAFAATSGMLQIQTFVIALYPFCFIEMDGYHVLVDVLGVPTLKQDAVAFVGALIRGRRRGRRGLRPWTREKSVWIGYVGLSTASIAAFLIFNVWMVLRAIS